MRCFSRLLRPSAELLGVCMFAFVQVGGNALEEAMSHNTTVTECNIHLTDIEERRVSVINQMVWNNQFRKQETNPREKNTENAN